MNQSQNRNSKNNDTRHLVCLCGVGSEHPRIRLTIFSLVARQLTGDQNILYSVVMSTEAKEAKNFTGTVLIFCPSAQNIFDF